ncbi:arginine deiminase type-3 [Metarhizium album ARSEF 1941]|uniref:Arginine deiminase type-3 n=1 Tax=Metarhizium album (strain ARSEF 1941) TaxID=1081103 RepID=A0A0B2WY09_METAS|nr:arginine deiminase type-3 [Metarhizium album ARSEF 1941]KHN98938.1 arginine deiminase type-3 [Metarhizium album ARSEF 1941]
MPSTVKAAAVVVGLLATSIHALSATILADTNRDGRVDVNGTSDVEGKATWTEDRGAIFLANIPDAYRRCTLGAPNVAPFMKMLDSCHDASDNVLRNPKFLAPLRTLPNPDLSDSATGVVIVCDKRAAKKVRIFHKMAGNWTYVDKRHTFKAADLRAGLELGIDSRDVRRPGAWNGTVTVNFNLTDRGESVYDTVALRVAPILIGHALNKVEQAFTVTGEYRPQQEAFAERLQSVLAEHGFEEPVARLHPIFGWAHDYFKAGYISMPGPDGPISLRVYIKSSIIALAAQRVYTHFRSASAGAAQHWKSSSSESDKMGNLQVVTPYCHGGRCFPLGRVVMGYSPYTSHQKAAAIFPFMQHQEAQLPFLLDHGWLYYGAIAEYLQFVPANNSRGWTIVVGDPHLAFNLLKEANEAGHGKLPAAHRPHLKDDPFKSCFSRTVKEVVQLPFLPGITKWTAAKIQYNVDVLKHETGVTDDEIVRVPALFYPYGGLASPRKLYCLSHILPSINHPVVGEISEPEHWPAKTGVIGNNLYPARPPWPSRSLFPIATDGLAIGEGQYLAPNPWGPLVNGTDIFAEATSKAFAKAGLNVTYFDNWLFQHEVGGGMHRATNLVRDISQKWW